MQSTLLRHPLFHLLLVIGLAALYLSPGLHSDYLADDSARFAQIGQMGCAPPQLGTYITGWHKYWLSKGRFYPFQDVFHDTALYLFRTRPAFKTYLMILGLFSFLLFYFVAREATQSPSLALLATAFAIPLVQLQASPPDPLFFNGTFAWAFLCLCGSVLSLYSFLKTPRRAYQVLSVLLYLVAALTYEAAIPLVALPLFIVAFSGRPRRDRLRLSIPYLAALAVLILCSLSARWWASRHSGTVYLGVSWGLSPLKILRALVAQISSTLPFSHGLSGNIGVFRTAIGLKAHLVSVLVAVLGMGCLWFLLFKTRRPACQTLKSQRLPIAIGVSLLVLPALVVACSSLRQDAIFFGLPYMVQYFQWFGLALLLAVGLARLRQVHRPLLLIAFAATLGLGFDLNQKAVKKMMPLRRVREATANALRRGLYSKLDSHATWLISTPDMPWQTWTGAQFHQQYTGICKYLGSFERPADSRNWWVYSWRPAARPIVGTPAIVERSGLISNGRPFVAILTGYPVRPDAEGWPSLLRTERVRVYLPLRLLSPSQPTLLYESKTLPTVRFQETQSGTNWSIWEAELAVPLDLSPSKASLQIILPDRG